LVIGSGPSAWASIAAIPGQYSILNIDLGATESENTKGILQDTLEMIQKEPINVEEINAVIQGIVDLEEPKLGTSKKIYGDGYMYDTSRASHMNSTTVCRSQALGGYGSVWGATMLPLPKTYLDQFSSQLKNKFNRGYSFLQENIEIVSYDSKNTVYEFPKELKKFSIGTTLQTKCLSHKRKFIQSWLKNIDANFEPIGLAVRGLSNVGLNSSDETCSKCGLCQIGCPKNLIWNPRYEQSKRIKHNYSYKKAEVKKIISNGKNLIIECTNFGEIYEAEVIILAAGALGTAEIISKSQLHTNFRSLRIKDNQTLFRHALSLQRVGNLHPRLNLAELTLSIGRLGKKPLNAQLYSISPYTKMRIFKLYPFLKKMPIFFQNFMLFRIVTLLVYLDENESGYITISQENELIEIQEQTKDLKLMNRILNYQRMGISLFTKGILLLPIFQQKMGVGGGNHIGSTEFQNNVGTFEKICDEQGVLKGEKNILISDSSALPHLYPGPITMSAMAYGYANVSDFFSMKN